MALFRANAANNSTPGDKGNSTIESGFDITNINSVKDLREQLATTLDFDCLEEYDEDELFQLNEQAGNYRALGQMGKRVSKAKLQAAKEINNLINLGYGHHNGAMKTELAYEKNTAKFLENASLAYLDLGQQQNDQRGFSQVCGQAEKFLDW